MYDFFKKINCFEYFEYFTQLHQKKCKDLSLQNSLSLEKCFECLIDHVYMTSFARLSSSFLKAIVWILKSYKQKCLRHSPNLWFKFCNFPLFSLCFYLTVSCVLRLLKILRTFRESNIYAPLCLPNDRIAG